jgi:putative ABC transport system permease protein
MATANIPNPPPVTGNTLADDKRERLASKRTRPLPLPKLSSFDRTLASARTTMVFSEVLQLAFDSFRASKVRFMLTMLGMVIGSASIVLVVTLGLTGKEYALNLLSSIGPNMIEMQYNGGSIVGPDNTSTPDNLTREDMLAIQEQVPGIAASSPMLEAREDISIGNGLTKNVMILGVSPQYKDVRNSEVVAGRFFDDQDTAGHTHVAVLVKTLAETLFGSPDNAVGQTLSIRGIPFTIIGVFKERIDTFGQSEISDQTMLIPYTVARYFTGTDTVKEIFFSMKETGSVIPASQQILKIIHDRHRPSSVYTAQTMTPVLETMAKIADMLTLVLTLAAAVTLIVSGVGIMNSMLANVQARVKEIGIRKALGATSREIRMQFLTESVCLSLSGGLVGTLIGLAIPFSVRFLTPFAIPVDWWSAVAALTSSMLVGIIFGTLPANRAARLDPVETLKYE